MEEGGTLLLDHIMSIEQLSGDGHHALSETDALLIFVQIVKGLQAFHCRGIIL